MSAQMSPNQYDHRLICAPDSPLQVILQDLRRIAAARAPVLVLGESGTGKEGIVRALHALAPWHKKPLVPINCGAIPAQLLESELFGHVRGSFTGAERNRVGRIEAVGGGTLFLDEIAELPIELQVKLLRVLQEKVFYPVGSSVAKTADFRVVAATNTNLSAAVDNGTFRQDLYFRLDVVRVQVPPLRARPMDLPCLSRFFLEKYRGPNNSAVTDFTAGALKLLASYDWPGNIRELENVVQSILVLKEDGVIDEDDVRPKLNRGSVCEVFDSNAIALPDEGLPLRETLERLELRIIRGYLQKVNGNKARAANLLGLKRTTLVEKLKRYDALQL